MSLGQILRQRREELKLTLDEVSNRVGFSKPYLSTIETERVKNPPSDELLTKLERVLKFEKGLLLHIAHVEGLPADVREEFESAEAENQKWKKIVQSIIDKKTKTTNIKRVVSRNKLSLKEDKSVLAPGRLVPIINKVAAGYPSDFNDLDYPVGVADDYVRCPDLHDPNAFAVRVIGDSMEPKFHAGDIVVFSPATEVRSGDDCFVRFTMPHETTFKRVFFEKGKKVRLQPRNDKYPPSIIEGDRINGLYRAVLRYEKL
ncbi:MAG: S24 family peptidase [Sedimentisphaerales bacterium]